MSYLIIGSEPDRQPHRAILRLNTPESRLRLYLMSDRALERAGLRATVMRAAEEPPPPESELLVELAVVRQAAPHNPGEAPPPPELRLLPRVLGAHSVLVENEGERDGREQLSTAASFANGAPLYVERPGTSEVVLYIEVQDEGHTGARVAVAGLDAPDDAALSDVSSVIWAVPTAANALSAPGAKVVAAFKSYAKRLKIPPALLMPLIMVGTLLLGMGYATWKNHQRAEEAEARLTEREEALAVAVLQRDAALEGEGACLNKREELTEELGDQRARLLVILEQVLNRAQVKALAAGLAGERALDPRALAFDDAGWERLLALLVETTAHARVEPGLVAPCLAQRDTLGAELPTYALLWHPDAELQCPEGYLHIDGQVSRAGRWGLSERAARLYGEGYVTAPVDDPSQDLRARDAWAVMAMTKGLRDTLKGLLTAPSPGRAPMAPSAATLWALAVWDAYNHLPLPPEGLPITSAQTCASELVARLHGASTDPTPGQPVLPDIAAVARGEAIVGFAATPSCPWPERSLQDGAARALQAAAREAELKRATPQDDGA
ncbi:MAG: hypothetical protein IPI35_27345 [Deltaproteobacteria bacterium]|nr:hypothetical protein [Deltaproteobacteria bacterium]